MVVVEPSEFRPGQLRVLRLLQILYTYYISHLQQCHNQIVHQSRFDDFALYAQKLDLSKKIFVMLLGAVQEQI